MGTEESGLIKGWFFAAHTLTLKKCPCTPWCIRESHKYIHSVCFRQRQRAQRETHSRRAESVCEQIKKGAACSSSRLGVAKINASSTIEMLPTFSIARSLRKNTHAALYYSHADDAELERERNASARPPTKPAQGIPSHLYDKWMRKSQLEINSAQDQFVWITTPCISLAATGSCFEWGACKMNMLKQLEYNSHLSWQMWHDDPFFIGFYGQCAILLL